MEERIKIARSLGASWIAGMTQPENAAMLHVLRALDFQEMISTLPGVYQQASPPLDGVLFMLNLQAGNGQRVLVQGDANRFMLDLEGATK
jgi:hypothetical protein